VCSPRLVLRVPAGSLQSSSVHTRYGQVSFSSSWNSPIMKVQLVIHPYCIPEGAGRVPILDVKDDGWCSTLGESLLNFKTWDPSKLGKCSPHCHIADFPKF
jgi:hypothetical protein